MVRANVVTPAFTRSPPRETTKLLEDGHYGKHEDKHYRPSKNAGFGAIFVLIWTGVLQSEASQSLQVYFNKPFFLVCFNHAAPVALLPLLIGYYKFFGSSADRYANSISVLENHSVIPLPKLLHMSAMLSIFYLVAEYFWYAAITNMSVAVGTAIYNCSPLFVYCLSVCFLHEQLSFKKAFGMLTSLLGVMLVIMFQDGSNVDSIEGTSIVAGLLMVVSAALYAGYQVSLRLMVGEDFTHSPTLLMLAGFCGLFTIPPWILGSFLMAESPFPLLYESLGLPGTGEGIVLLVLCGILMVVFCAFQPLAICWTSPLETSVGCMLMLPVSGIMDTMVHHTVFSWQCIVGSLLVMGGFVILEARKKKSMPKPQDSDVTFSPCA